MNRKLIGSIASGLVLVALAFEIVPAVVLGGLFEGSAPGWVPTIGTVGETVVLYSQIVELAAPLATTAVAVSAGYLLRQRLVIDRVDRSFFGAVAVGAALPIVVGWLLAIAGLLLGSFSTFDFVYVSVLALRFLVTTSLLVLVAMLAGTALPPIVDRGSSPTNPERGYAPSSTE